MNENEPVIPEPKPPCQCPYCRWARAAKAEADLRAAREKSTLAADDRPEPLATEQ